MSGIGKGVIGMPIAIDIIDSIVQCIIVASSTGLLLKTTGLKVTAIKIDPYMNIDAGTMRPQEHGERTSMTRDITSLNVDLYRRGLCLERWW